VLLLSVVFSFNNWKRTPFPILVMAGTAPGRESQLRC
jgi:hypothetical protein